MKTCSFKVFFLLSVLFVSFGAYAAKDPNFSDIENIEIRARQVFTGHAYYWPQKEFLQVFQKLQCNDALRQEGYVWDTTRLADVGIKRMNQLPNKIVNSVLTQFNFFLGAFYSDPLNLDTYLRILRQDGFGFHELAGNILRGLIQNHINVIVRLSQGELLPGGGVSDPRVQRVLRDFDYFYRYRY